jgi:uncharacterized repeat protein (TIGR03803 family)
MGSANVRARRARIEGLESRRLLSGYTFQTLAGLNSSQLSGPDGAIVQDAGGNMFFLATQGGTSSSTEAACELPKGSSSPTVLATFPNNQGNVGGLAIDPAGDLFGTLSTGGASNDGTVWEIAAGSGGVNTLASFDNATTGGDPISNTQNVVLDADGNLFGTAQTGGAGNGGTVWELPKYSGTITALASFVQSASNNAVNGLTMDSFGALFGTIGRDTSVNGAHGAVWELAKGVSQISVLATFDGTNGDGPQSPLVVDGSGNIFGETNAGGSAFTSSTAGNGTFFELADGTGTFTTLANFSGTLGEQGPQKGVVADASANLFTQTNNGVFELAKGSSTITPAETYAFASTGTGAGTTLLADANGNLFGGTALGGPQNGGVIFELTSGGGTVTPTSSLTGTLAGKVPATGIAGQRVNLAQALAVTNGGTSTLSGTTGFRLYLSTGTSLDANSIQLASTSRKARLRPHGRLSVPFRVTKLPASVPAGTYHLVAQITDSSGNTSDAASTGTITVAPPTIDLSGAFVGTSTPAKNGRTTVTFTVTENGNVPATGPLTFDIGSSPDGLLSDATLLSTLTRRINIPAGKSARMTVALTLPAGTYSLLMLLDPQNAFNDVNLANNAFATSSMVTVP